MKRKSPVLENGWLRMLREAAGLTQSEVAARLGVTKGCVSRWESGETAPTATRQLQYARACGRKDGGR